MESSAANFLAHIIRDVFHPHDGVVNYSNDHLLVEELRKPEHSIEAWRLYTADNEEQCEHAFNWKMEWNGTYFGNDFCSLFYAAHLYNPFSAVNHLRCALQVARFMKQDGIVVVSGRPSWALSLDQVLRPRPDLVEELSRYSMVSAQRPLVFQKR